MQLLGFFGFLLKLKVEGLLQSLLVLLRLDLLALELHRMKRLLLLRLQFFLLQ